MKNKIYTFLLVLGFIFHGYFTLPFICNYYANHIASLEQIESVTTNLPDDSRSNVVTITVPENEVLTGVKITPDTVIVDIEKENDRRLIELREILTNRIDSLQRLEDLHRIDNEIQTPYTTGNTITLSGGGGSISVSSINDDDFDNQQIKISY